MQRVADDRGLLVNLLLHEMAKIALADGGARKSRLDYRTLHRLVRGVINFCLSLPQNNPIALFQIAKPIGKGG